MVLIKKITNHRFGLKIIYKIETIIRYGLKGQITSHGLKENHSKPLEVMVQKGAIRLQYVSTEE